MRKLKDKLVLIPGDLYQEILGIVIAYDLGSIGIADAMGSLLPEEVATLRRFVVAYETTEERDG
jgi:hypothetical protein